MLGRFFHRNQVQVDLYYDDEMARLTIPLTETVKSVMKVISLKIQKFAKIDFILIREVDQKREILDIDSTFEAYSGQQEISLLAFPNPCQCKIRTADQEPRNYDINISLTVSEIIASLIEEGVSSYYALAFQVPGEQSLHVLCHSMPLVTQMWNNDPLILIRRLHIDDVPQLADDAFRQFLLRNSRLAASSNLCYYSLNTWADLAALQIVYENRPQDLMTIRQNISLFVASDVKLIETLPDLVYNNVKFYSGATKPQAEALYITMAATSGSQCAFTENIKFRDKSMIWNRSRIVLVTIRHIRIIKDFTSPHECEVLHSDEYDVAMSDGSLMLKFPNGDYWTITGSLHIDILYNVILEMRQWGTEQGRSDESYKRDQKFMIKAKSEDYLDKVSESGTFSGVVRRKKVPLGVTKVVPCDEEDREYGMLKESIKTLKVVREMVDEERVDDKTEIDRLKFFKQSRDQIRFRNFVFAMIAVVFAILMRNVFG
jgi:hypothetical protein